MSLPADVSSILDLALAEDVGAGDWTTLWTIPGDRQGSARIIAKERGVIAGVGIATETFARVDSSVEVEVLASDGTEVEAGDVVLRLRGPAGSILTAERVALNFLQRLSGVATLTRAFVQAVAETDTRILDTRKTTPGMRRLEKEAVRIGGGENHRFGLHDAILLKENHLRAAGGIAAAVARVRERNRAGLLVEVETTDLEEVIAAIDAHVDRILLDNMPLATLRSAVQRIRAAPRPIGIEASGGVTLESVSRIARTGVDFISVGALTHSAPALDLSLLFDEG